MSGTKWDNRDAEAETAKEDGGRTGEVDDMLLNLLIPVIWKSVEHASIVVLGDSFATEAPLYNVSCGSDSHGELPSGSLNDSLDFTSHEYGRSQSTSFPYLECADGQAE